MFCPKCGNKLKGDEKFCGNCGAAILVEDSLTNDHVNHGNNTSNKNQSNRVYTNDGNSFVIKNPGDNTPVAFAVPNKELYRDMYNEKTSRPSKVDERNANMLSLFSLIFGFGADTLIALIGLFLPKVKELLTNLGIVGGLPLVGLVLMIVARVKYPQNKFAKIVMWIYIVSAILTIIGIMVFFVTCLTACRGLQ